jgi:3-oxoadipate enol-lactonase
MNTMGTEAIGYNLTTTVNNIHMSYDDIGEGKIPVIFLHGYPFDKTMWRLQLEALKSSNRVIACDIRGFGASKNEESSFSIDLFADDLIKFMDKLTIDKAVICGLSMGGFIALNALKRFPSRFEALILCDTQCIADTPEVKEKRYQIIDEIAAYGVHNFNERFIKSVFHKDSLSNKKELVDALRSVVFANSQHIITKGQTALALRSETCSMLREISIPTLIICGREDTVTPLSQSEFMNKNIKGSILKVIDNAGHVSNLEQPDEFNKHLFDFLTSINVADLENFSGRQNGLES